MEITTGKDISSNIVKRNKLGRPLVRVVDEAEYKKSHLEREKISDSYVRLRLVSNGISDPTPEIIALYRIRIILKRLLARIKKDQVALKADPIYKAEIKARLERRKAENKEKREARKRERYRAKYQRHPKVSKRPFLEGAKYECGVCKQIKDASEFRLKRNKAGVVYCVYICNACRSAYQAEWRRENTEVCLATRERTRPKRLFNIKTLADPYIKKRLRDEGIPITPETIEVKRCLIMLRRNLKKLKGRIKHESNCDVVAAEQ